MKKIDGRKTKSCTCCEKTFIESIGFHRRESGTEKYQAICKICKNQKENERLLKNKGGSLDHHRWKIADNHNISECERCGLLRKQIAFTKVNQWAMKYLVKGKWIDERPENCFVI